MRQDTSKGNGGADERIELLITADGELQVARGDALDLEVLGGIACKLEHFGSKVFEDGSQVDGSFGTDPRLLSGNGSQVTLYATAGELKVECRVSAMVL